MLNDLKLKINANSEIDDITILDNAVSQGYLIECLNILVKSINAASGAINRNIADRSDHLYRLIFNKVAVLSLSKAIDIHLQFNMNLFSSSLLCQFEINNVNSYRFNWILSLLSNIKDDRFSMVIFMNELIKCYPSNNEIPNQVFKLTGSSSLDCNTFFKYGRYYEIFHLVLNELSMNDSIIRTYRCSPQLLDILVASIRSVVSTKHSLLEIVRKLDSTLKVFISELIKNELYKSDWAVLRGQFK